MSLLPYQILLILYCTEWSLQLHYILLIINFRLFSACITSRNIFHDSSTTPLQETCDHQQQTINQRVTNRHFAQFIVNTYAGHMHSKEGTR
jgi:hypothetical protein